MTDDKRNADRGAPANEAARELSRLGASKGGVARASVLTPEERRDIAREAVKARWLKAGKLKAIEAGTDKPIDVEAPAIEERPLKATMPYSMLPGKLTIGNVDMECHVLNDGRRVLTQREVVRVLSGGRESGNLTRYFDRNPLISADFESGPIIRFRVPASKMIANGYEATLLIEICEKYLAAWEQGLLKRSQYKLVKQAEIVVRACAKVGIIALIDEATGYQEIRAKRALQLKLQAFIAEEMQEWARMFPDEFWFELARLEGVRYSPRSRPLRWGRYIMLFVYDAVDPDVGRELRAKNPSPRFLRNHHQWLKTFGREKVHDQIERVVTIMKLCDTMDEFRAKFARVFKKSPLQMEFGWDSVPAAR